MAYALLDYVKIIDLGWPWRSVSTYSSDSWASCFVSRDGAFTQSGLFPGGLVP